MLFVASTDPHVQAVLALDPRSGRQLWSSANPAAGGSIGSIHWESPIVVGGRLYCTDEDGQITAYGLASGTTAAERNSHAARASVIGTGVGWIGNCERSASPGCEPSRMLR